MSIRRVSRRKVDGGVRLVANKPSCEVGGRSLLRGSGEGSLYKVGVTVVQGAYHCQSA